MLKEEDRDHSPDSIPIQFNVTKRDRHEVSLLLRKNQLKSDIMLCRPRAYTLAYSCKRFGICKESICHRIVRSNRLDPEKLEHRL